MIKVLFIIQSYPSEKSANVLCDTNIMKTFIKSNNYEVHCLCSKYSNQKSEEIIDGVHVHRVNRGLWWKLYSEAQFRNKKNGKYMIKINRLIMRIKQFIFIPLFPVYEPIFLYQMKKESVKLFDKEKFDVVFAEYNGLETIYAGWQLKCNRNILFIPIFWDSMSGGFRPKYLPSRYVDKRKYILEKKILYDCDQAIMMLSHRKHILKLYENESVLIDKIKFLDIPYLTINKMCSSPVFDKTKINIVFAGNMHHRNPCYFFKVLKESALDNIVVHFITKVEDHRKIKEDAKEYNISIKLYDYMDHDILVNYLDDADILLNFGVDNPNAISGKIFEYIGFMKPIISTYSIDNEAAIRVLNKYPCSLLLDERKNPKEYQYSILELLDFSKIVNVNEDSIKKTFKDNMPEAYLMYLETILKERDSFEQ